jgi:hypothetical protein
MASPDARVLVGFEGKLKAFVDDCATRTKVFRLLDRDNCAAGCSDGEEQLWISVSAECAITPLVFCR